MISAPMVYTFFDLFNYQMLQYFVFFVFCLTFYITVFYRETEQVYAKKSNISPLSVHLIEGR